MQWLIEIVWSNSLVVLALAAVVWCVAKCARRPAVTHALCVLLLLKLLTPPIFRLPLPPSLGIEVSGAFLTAADSDSTPAMLHGNTPAAEPRRNHRAGVKIENSDRTRYAKSQKLPSASEHLRRADEPAAQQSNRRSFTEYLRELPLEASAEDDPTSRRAIAAPVVGNAADDSRLRTIDGRSWAHIGVAIWLGGALFWFVSQCVLGLRLRRNLRASQPATRHVQAAAAEAARQMGLRRCPRVCTIRTADPPMLCGLGRWTCIVIPADLSTRLGRDGLATILAHELAHYRRGDQWVRLIELVATGFYWWHPVLWWARRRIEIAEEQCCDAQVLSVCRGQSRIYAEALLDIVDLISEPAIRLRTVMSSGIHPHHLLQTRLKDLMEERYAATATPRVRRAVWLIGAVCLLFHPAVFYVAATPGARATSMPGEAFRSSPEEIARGNQFVGTPFRPADVGNDFAGMIAPAVGTPQAEPAFSSGETLFEDQVPWATAVSSDGRYRISVNMGYTCELYDDAHGEVRPLQGHLITCVAFLPDSTGFITGDILGIARRWDTVTGLPTDIIARQNGPIYSVDVSANFHRAAVAGHSGTIEIVDLESSTGPKAVLTCDAPLRCVRFSPTGDLLAVATDTWRTSDDGRIAIYDVADMVRLRHWQLDSPIGAVEFASDDKVWVADWGGRVTRWSWADARRLGQLIVDKESVSAASFSADTRVFQYAQVRLLPVVAGNNYDLPDAAGGNTSRGDLADMPRFATP